MGIGLELGKFKARCGDSSRSPTGCSRPRTWALLHCFLQLTSSPICSLSKFQDLETQFRSHTQDGRDLALEQSLLSFRMYIQVAEIESRAEIQVSTLRYIGTSLSIPTVKSTDGTHS